MPSMPSLQQPPDTSGGRLVSVDGKTLPLTQASLTADAKGGVIQVKLTQTFVNPHHEPLKVTYTLPLPADSAVSGFAFTIGDTRVIGEVDTKKQARQRFEDAVLSGKTAAILDQERSSLFTQEVGNVPPRLSVVCEVTLDQKLAWLADGAWEWRFPTVVAPRYLGEPGRVVDSAKVSVDVADQALPVKLTLGMTIRDRLVDGQRPESPSHALHTAKGLSSTDVAFGDGAGVRLDRDVVVRWRVAQPRVGLELDLSRPVTGPAATSAYGLMTLVPPSAEARLTPLSRDLIVLLDTSGSMSGLPLEQAQRFTAALIDSLSERDTLELIEFSNEPRRWQKAPAAATPANRKAALAWVMALRASGGTEMARGIIEALSPLRAEAQRQIVLITDGLIGSEHEVLNAIGTRLPPGSRVHTIGVGSGVNRSLTQPAARAGRGVELVMGLGEDVEVSTRRLLARTESPLLTDVVLDGTALEQSAAQRLPDVYAGAPALLSMRLNADGGTLVVRARMATGEFVERLEVPPTPMGHGPRHVATLFAREQVEDLEAQRHVEGRSVDAAVERVGLDFQIATRLTSWVAVSEQATVDPRLARRHVTQPHELAYGLSAEGVGLRPVMSAPSGGAVRSRMSVSAAMPPPPAPVVFESADDESFEEVRRVAAPSPSMSSKAAPEKEAAAPRRERDEKAKKTKQSPVPGRLGGLIDRVKDALSGPKGHGEVRRIRGRVLRRAGNRVDIELVVDAMLDWALSADAELVLPDGTTVAVQVNQAFTTSPGVYGAGLVLTITLTTVGDVPRATEVRLTTAGASLVIELSEA